MKWNKVITLLTIVCLFAFFCEAERKIISKLSNSENPYLRLDSLELKAEKIFFQVTSDFEKLDTSSKKFISYRN